MTGVKKKKWGLGLLGLGTVGSGVVEILSSNAKLIESRTGITFDLRKVCVRDLKKQRSAVSGSFVLTDKPEEILNDPEIDIVVEVMGGLEPAGNLIQEAIRRGKHVVTANKALLADRGAEIFNAVREKGVSIGYEAAVAGGVPILKALREGFVGNKIQTLFGIINGTCNFILSEMSEKGSDFSQVLKEAQKAGYAEQDPTYDVQGLDAAQKLSLLISLAYGVVPPREGIFVEGIDRITSLDIEFAKKLGYAVKLLAIAKDHAGAIEARVHPTMVPLNHPLAEVKGTFNAIFLAGDAVGDAMFLGKGAGRLPTGSAVVSDLVMIALGLAGENALAGLKPATLQPMESLTTAYYLRFSVVDRPGVLSQIAKGLGDAEISIASVYQRERDEGARVPIVVMTHQAKEESVRRAVEQIDSMEAVVGKTVVIRVESFK